MNNVDWKKFIIVFFITASLFAMGIYFSNYLSNLKINQIKDAQDKISIDILSSETRFALLKQTSCEDLKGDSILSDELTSVGSRLEFLESTLGSKNEDVIGFKKYYSILEIKDYILMKEVSARCKSIPHFVLYFSSTVDCSNCSKQWYALTEIHDKYPELRVYTFDYNTDLSAVRSLLQIFKIKGTELPALVLDDTLLPGFHSVNDLDIQMQKFFKSQHSK
ncbi:MAG: hypothetical protein WCI76_00425 [bacterium]